MKKNLSAILFFILTVSFLATLSSCKENSNNSDIKSVKVGDYIKFGAYEQDNNLDNGNEKIEWLVLDVKDGRALLISKYALACKPYGAKTWEDSAVRKWLNDEFFDAAFTEKEKEQIPTVTLPSEKGLDPPELNTGKETQDRVFLLSCSETELYFSRDVAKGHEYEKQIKNSVAICVRRCFPTAYVSANGVSDFVSGQCPWWLRSDSSSFLDVSSVDPLGRFYSTYYGTEGCAVRPAMWVSLDS